MFVCARTKKNQHPVLTSISPLPFMAFPLVGESGLINGTQCAHKIVDKMATCILSFSMQRNNVAVFILPPLFSAAGVWLRRPADAPDKDTTGESSSLTFQVVVVCIMVCFLCMILKCKLYVTGDLHFCKLVAYGGRNTLSLSVNTGKGK